ncbi:bacteriophage T4 gp5 trimerisation domain-containing protein, partial [Helicobacter trogontum]|uniref:bacteriophage T4 gp5 trimerisation domain-containing protein n=1 Tax=Helicobacter trogontum TaxID=50960 RepID=UPI0030B804EB
YTDEYGRVKVRMNIYANQEKRDNALLERIQKDNAQDSDSQSNMHTNIQNNDLQNNQISSNSNNIVSSKDNSINQTNTNQENIITITNQTQHNKDTTNTNTIQTHSSPNKRYSYTPFLRVASPIASNSSGFYHTPRIGDEVIISFLDNDIDKPFISGSLYNTTNPSLIHNPLDSHKTSLSSRTINLTNIRNSSDSLNQADSSQTEHSNTTNTIEQGYNELTLSNIKDNEEIYIRAQKDYRESINNNFSQTIHNNKDSKVKGSYTESITKYHKQEILGLKDVRVGAEYLTNVALSKDTIVGLSNTLNVGASNKLRVAKDSSEYVGGDKEVEIGNNLCSSVGGDLHQFVKGERQEHIEGSLTQNVVKDIDIATQNYTLLGNEKIVLQSTKAMSFITDENLSLEAHSSNAQIQSDYSIQAGNTLNFNIGETTIAASSDSVIIKAGGVEVVIDSNGLVVKGGEIKSE